MSTSRPQTDAHRRRSHHGRLPLSSQALLRNCNAHCAAGWAAVVFIWIFAIGLGFSWGPARGLSSRRYPRSACAQTISISRPNRLNNFGMSTPDFITSAPYGVAIFLGNILRSLSPKGAHTRRGGRALLAIRAGATRLVPSCCTTVCARFACSALLVSGSERGENGIPSVMNT